MYTLRTVFMISHLVTAVLNSHGQDVLPECCNSLQTPDTHLNDIDFMNRLPSNVLCQDFRSVNYNNQPFLINLRTALKRGGWRG